MSMIPIATSGVLSGGQTSVTFSSIPSTFTHLQIRCFTKFSSAADIVMQFNSDTGTNYSYHGVYGDGANALNLSGSGGTKTYVYIGYNATNGTSFDSSVVDILDYSNTNKYKTVRSLHGVDMNGSGFAMLNSGSWQNTAAISTIVIGGGTFSQYSRIDLYGITNSPATGA